MALIKNFEKREPVRESVHGTVDCDYYTFQKDDQQYIQFSTYGSRDRQIKNKQSQVFQLDKQSAQELIDILQTTFKLAD